MGQHLYGVVIGDRVRWICGVLGYAFSREQAGISRPTRIDGGFISLVGLGSVKAVSVFFIVLDGYEVPIWSLSFVGLRLSLHYAYCIGVLVSDMMSPGRVYMKLGQYKEE